MHHIVVIKLHYYSHVVHDERHAHISFPHFPISTTASNGELHDCRELPAVGHIVENTIMHNRLQLRANIFNTWHGFHSIAYLLHVSVQFVGARPSLETQKTCYMCRFSIPNVRNTRLTYLAFLLYIFNHMDDELCWLKQCVCTMHILTFLPNYKI